jgi:hypothetical protein
MSDRQRRVIVSVKDPCFSCQHRLDSIARITRYRERNPEGTGMPADPAPKIECKQHSGYGIEDATRVECRDYKPVNQ